MTEPQQHLVYLWYLGHDNFVVNWPHSPHVHHPVVNIHSPPNVNRPISSTALAAGEPVVGPSVEVHRYVSHNSDFPDTTCVLVVLV